MDFSSAAVRSVAVRSVAVRVRVRVRDAVFARKSYTLRFRLSIP